MINNSMTYYKKILFSCMAVVVLIITILNLLCINYLVDKKNEYISGEKNTAEEHYDEVERKLQMFTNICELIANDESVRVYAESDTFSDEYYQYILIGKIISEMSNVLSQPNMKIMICKEDSELCITSAETTTKDLYLSNIKADITAFNNRLTEMKNKGNMYTVFIGSHDVSNINLIYQHKFPTGKIIIFFITAELDYFVPRSINSDNYIAIMDTESGIAKGNNTGMQDVILELKKNNRINIGNVEWKTGFVRNSMLVSNMMFIFENNSPWNTTVLLILNVVIYAVLIIMGVRVAKRISKRIYQPFYISLSKFNYDGNENELEFLNKKIQELIEKDKLFKSKQTEQQVKLKEKFFAELFFGVLGNEEIIEGIEEYGLDYLKQSTRCILFEYEIDKKERLEDFHSENDEIKSNFITLARTYLKAELNGELVNVGNTRFAINTSYADITYLTPKLIELVDIAYEMFKIKLLIFIGTKVESCSEIYNSYAYAEELMEYRFAWDNKMIFSEDDMKNVNTYFYPPSVENTLVQEILGGNKEKYETILNNTIKRNLFDTLLDKYNLKEFKFALSMSVQRILNQINKKPEDIFGGDISVYLELNSADTNAELVNCIKEIFDTIYNYVAKNKKDKKDKAVKGILEYIEKNCYVDLSLADVARHLGVSQGHIGRILRNEAGISFKEYIDVVRIKKAKAMLSEKRSSVTDVAFKLGYNNTKTFINVFKKYEGITPGTYMKNNDN